VDITAQTVCGRILPVQNVIYIYICFIRAPYAFPYCDNCVIYEQRHLPKPVLKNIGFSPTRSFDIADFARNTIAVVIMIIYRTGNSSVVINSGICSNNVAVPADAQTGTARIVLKLVKKIKHGDHYSQ